MTHIFGQYTIPETGFLDTKKLRTLWNLEQEASRLVVISKMQNPFKHEKSFKTFRDDSDDIYGEIKRLQWQGDINKVRDVIESRGLSLDDLASSAGPSELAGTKISVEIFEESKGLLEIISETELSESRVKAIIIELIRDREER